MITRNQGTSLRAVAAICLLAVTLLAYIPPAHSLYYYSTAAEQKCFIEELPIETVVVGHYMAETWHEEGNKFEIESNMNLMVSVKERETGHQLVSTLAPAEGKFAFTSHVAGDHDICLWAVPGESHRHHNSADKAQVRVHLDIVIGEAKPDSTQVDRSHITDLAGRVRSLNDKLKDIRKEQQFQREREAAFRDESEKTNARAVIYSAIQGVILVAACVWQLRTLRGYFSEKKFS